jgi:protease I
MMEDNKLKNKSVVMVVAFRDFRDEEYFVPKKIFEENGIKITTASSSLGKAIGKLGGDTEIDVLIENINVDNYDAVIFIGGPGAYNYFENKVMHQIAQETIEKNKILAAICIAPVILAKSGVLKGRNATVWSSLLDKSAIKILKDNGAFFKDESVVVDGRIITASGPSAAEEFANKIINLLKQNGR